MKNGTPEWPQIPAERNLSMSERLAEMVRGLRPPATDDDSFRDGWFAGNSAAADLIANSPELAEMNRRADSAETKLRETREVLVLARKYADLNQPYFGMTQNQFFEKIGTAIAAIDAAQLGEGTR